MTRPKPRHTRPLSPAAPRTGVRAALRETYGAGQQTAFTLWTLIALLAVLLFTLGPARSASAQSEYDSRYDDDYGYDNASYGDPDEYGSYEPNPDHPEVGYSYVRLLEGSGTLIQGDTRDREELQAHQPILVGDRLWMAPGGRAEVLLSDFNLLRVGGDSEVEMLDLAASPDTSSSRTHLRLNVGEAQLVTFNDALGDELPRIDTADASLYLYDAGSYLVRTERGYTEVVVREGYAEVLSDGGSEMVRAGDAAIIERGRLRLVRAGRLAGLELWGEDLDARAAASEVDYVDPDLRYAASSLDGHGNWVYVDSRPAWRPRVSVGWEPYSDGRWVSTPSGLAWVSYEPWGAVPYHYGSWDYAPSYGWVWYPGRTWSPAWVVWYWGPRYVGWCPSGYYSNYYGNRYHHGLRYGTYGYAGGRWNWDHWDRWRFVSHEYVYDRRQAKHTRPGHDLRRDLRGGLERGLITTDTRGTRPSMVRDPQQMMRALSQRPLDRTGKTLKTARALPDVDAFVAREKLPDTVARQVVSARPAARPGAGRTGSGRPSVAGMQQARPSGSAKSSDASGRRPVMTRPGVRGDDRGRPSASDVRGARPSISRSPQAGSSKSRPFAGDVRQSRPSVSARPSTGSSQRPSISRPRPGTDDRGGSSARPSISRRPDPGTSGKSGASASSSERPRPSVSSRPRSGDSRSDGKRDDGASRRPPSRPSVSASPSRGSSGSSDKGSGRARI